LREKAQEALGRDDAPHEAEREAKTEIYRELKAFFNQLRKDLRETGAPAGMSPMRASLPNYAFPEAAVHPQSVLGDGCPSRSGGSADAGSSEELPTRANETALAAVAISRAGARWSVLCPGRRVKVDQVDPSLNRPSAGVSALWLFA